MLQGGLGNWELRESHCAQEKEYKTHYNQESLCVCHLQSPDDVKSYVLVYLIGKEFMDLFVFFAILFPLPVRIRTGKIGYFFGGLTRPLPQVRGNSFGEMSVSSMNTGCLT